MQTSPLANDKQSFKCLHHINIPSLIIYELSTRQQQRTALYMPHNLYQLNFQSAAFVSSINLAHIWHEEDMLCVGV